MRAMTALSVNMRTKCPEYCPIRPKNVPVSRRTTTGRLKTTKSNPRVVMNTIAAKGAARTYQRADAPKSYRNKINASTTPAMAALAKASGAGTQSSGSKMRETMPATSSWFAELPQIRKCFFRQRRRIEVVSLRKKRPWPASEFDIN